MKYSLAAVFAASVAAQSISSLPPCGQTCFNNLVTIAQTQFGCTAGDAACYCANQNFGFGIRDCSNESCPSPTDAADTIAFAKTYCANALKSAASTASTATTALSTLSVSSVSSVTTTPAVVTTTTQASSTATATATVTSMTAATGPLATVTSVVLPLSGSPGVYVIGGTKTISAGGKPYTSAGVVYSAAKTDVVIKGAGATTTVFPGATTILSTTAIVKTTASTTIPKGVTASSKTAIGSITKGVYVVGGSHTISAGGKPYVNHGTTYSAAPNGVVIVNAGSSTTFKPTSSVVGVGITKATITTKVGGKKTTMTTVKTTSNKSLIKSASSAAKASAKSKTSSGLAAIQTAAPGLLGAAALALFAL